jgi:hypothetical protein
MYQQLTSTFSNRLVRHLLCSTRHKQFCTVKSQLALLKASLHACKLKATVCYIEIPYTFLQLKYEDNGNWKLLEKAMMKDFYIRCSIS